MARLRSAPTRNLRLTERDIRILKGILRMSIEKWEESILEAERLIDKFDAPTVAEAYEKAVKDGKVVEREEDDDE